MLSQNFVSLSNKNFRVIYTDSIFFNVVLHLWDAAKEVIRGKYIAVQAFLKKQEKSQTYNLTLQLKKLEKE